MVKQVCLRLMALLLLALLTVLTSCGGSSNEQSNSTGNKLVVFVSGLSSHLSDGDVKQNNGYGFDSSWKSIQTYLQGTSEFQGAQFMAFSYRGFTSDGKPGVYFCHDTFNNSLNDDLSRLNLQITQYLKGHPNTDVYIVSHSLGGVIAFGYMAQLIEITHSNAIVDLGTHLGTLKGIAILDSPLGGITNTRWYDSGTVIKALSCDPLLVTYGTIGDLQGLFQNASSSFQQGETASILNYLGGSNISNQQVATDAANSGVAILIAANETDLLWLPDVGGFGTDFLSTEFLNELGKQNNNGALYSRSFKSGQYAFSAFFANAANHLDVLTNTDVQIAIWEVFTGHPLDKLTSLADSSTPTQQQTQQPTVPPTPVPDPIVSNTYSGQIVGNNGNATVTMTFTSVVQDQTGITTIQGNFSVASPLSNYSGPFNGTINNGTMQFTVTPSDGSTPTVYTGTPYEGTSTWEGQYTVNGISYGTWQIYPSS